MKELSQKLERLIETAVEKEEIAGANIVVIRDGQEMAFAADGYADIEAGKKYERDTIARLYSMTKPVTSAAAMLLMERGLLDPGAFVEEFLPGFHNAIVASGGKLVPTVRPVRICDLLNMTSGLMYGGDVTSVCSMRAALEIGDQVTTIGGIVGRVVAIKDDTFVLETGADRVKIRFIKNAISSVEKLNMDNAASSKK